MALDCTTCMACCLYEGMLPYEQAKLTDLPLSNELAAEAIERVDGRLDPRCAWLVVSQDSVDGGACGKCLHYDQRPRVCRDFKVGGDKCLGMREYKLRHPSEHQPAAPGDSSGE